MNDQAKKPESAQKPKINPLSETDAIVTQTKSTIASEKTRKSQVRAWALWDWGSAAFNAVVTTFVFSTYLASNLFIDKSVIEGAMVDGLIDENNVAFLAAQAGNQAVISNSLLVAGILIALFAPVLGQRSDGSGRRKLWLAVNTGIVVLLMGAMFFIAPGQEYLVYGAMLLAAGNVFFEFASVNYNAMLVQISTRDNMGRVSGFGWGMGYIGGIVLLLALLMLFIQSFGTAGAAGLLEVPAGESGGALNIRFAVLVSAAWFALFAIPVLLKVPELPKQERQNKTNFLQSYGVLFNTIKNLAKKSPQVLLFLLSSAIFRDGLSAVFTFGAIIAAQVFGFSTTMVMYFAVAANLVAGVGTFIGGWLDDKVGPKLVIMISLISMSIAGIAVFFLPREAEGTGGTGFVGFWVFGLILCLFVGPVQSASRSFLARLIPAGREGEIFGLYATTGRAVGFITTAVISAFLVVTEDPKWTIVGIVIVLMAGLITILPVKAKQEELS